MHGAVGGEHLFEEASLRLVLDVANCQRADEPITGQLAQLETRHPGGHEVKGWVLLTADVCVSIEDMEGETVNVTPRIIHLVFGDGRQSRDLWKLASEEVSLRGDLMEPHTAWHLGDIVMMNAVVLNN